MELFLVPWEIIEDKIQHSGQDWSRPERNTCKERSKVEDSLKDQDTQKTYLSWLESLSLKLDGQNADNP